MANLGPNRRGRTFGGLSGAAFLGEDAHAAAVAAGGYGVKADYGTAEGDDARTTPRLKHNALLPAGQDSAAEPSAGVNTQTLKMAGA